MVLHEATRYLTSHAARLQGCYAKLEIKFRVFVYPAKAACEAMERRAEMAVAGLRAKMPAAVGANAIVGRVCVGERCALVITLSLSLYHYFYLYAYSARALSHPFSPFLCLSIFIAPAQPSTYFLASLCLSSLPPSLSRSLSLFPRSLAPAIYISTSRLDMCCFNSCAEVEILRAMRSGKQSELTRRRFAIP